MPGTIAITVDTYGQLRAVTQRVLCWAKVGTAEPGKVQIDTQGVLPKVVIPEAMLASGHGSLVLKRGGTDLVAGYVAGSNVTFSAGNNALPMETNVNTCPSSAAQPNGTNVVNNVGGNPLAITLNYANVGAAGTVDILWGDGTSTLGAAESGASNHTYPGPGEWIIRVRDASSPTDLADFAVRVP